MISVDNLGFREQFSDVLERIEAICEGSSKYVHYESDSNLAKYMTQEKFNQLKEQIESRGKIKYLTTRDFFEIESWLTAMSYCIEQLQDIYKQKEYQIFCEVIHVEYNKHKMKKQIDKVKEEF